MDFYTYLHCAPAGTPFYVGKGRGYRAFNIKNRNNKLHRAVVSLHGASNIKIFVFHCDSEDQALTDEIQQIAQLRFDGYTLTNQSAGGDGSKYGAMTPETRAKISSSWRRRNPEYAKRIRAELQATKGFDLQKEIDHYYEKPTRGTNGMIPFTFFMPKQMISALKALSQKNGLSVSDLIRRSIEDYLRKQAKKKGD